MYLYMPNQYFGARQGKLVFLGGPITGAPRWQTSAARWFHDQLGSDELAVASPRFIRLSEDVGTDWVPGVSRSAQIDWETYHLKRANEKGVVMFWLPIEERHVEGREYAQTSRLELGEQIANHRYSDTRLVVGISPRFPGRDYIIHRLQSYPNVPVCDTLEETCGATWDMLHRE